MKHIRTLPPAEASPPPPPQRNWPGWPSNGSAGVRATASIAALACVAALGIAALATPASGTTTAAALAATSLSYSAADDSYVSAKYPAANFGSATVLASGSGAGDGKVIYLKFIVHSLPAGATNISGSLVLNRIASQYLPPTVGASRVASTWSEQSVTYANRPVLGASLGVLQTTTGSGRATWPVAVSGNSTVAFALTSSTAATAIYNSAEGAPERPVFRVTYTPPAAVVPPSSSKVWIGATCNAPTATIAVFNSCNSAIGPMKVRRSFNSSLPTSFAASSAKDDATYGYKSFVSWKPPGGDYVGAAAGKYDSAVAAWARSVPRTGIYATSYHEPENNMSGAQFVAMHRHLYTVVKTANSTIQWGPVYMSYWWQPTRLASIGGAAAWWVGADKADFTAIDNYSTPNPIQLSRDVQFMTWYNAMLSKGKPMIIAEYGQYSIRPGYGVDPAMQAKRAVTIAADAAWIKSQGRITMWLYWNGTGAQGNWTLTDAASKQAWKNVAFAGRQS